MLTPEEFYEWERTSRDTIDVKRCYIDIAGDFVSGILLSQIIYWFIPGEHGTKLRVEKEGRLWLAKGRADWWAECRITPKQFDRAIKILADLGFLEHRRFRFKGSPTIHICLNIEAIVERVNSILTKGEKPNSPKGENAIDPKVELEVDESGESLTKTPSETTPQTTPKEKGKGKPSPSSNGAEVTPVFDAMKAFYRYPDETDKDPIPNYGKEGKAIKRMLERGFSTVEIVQMWMKKCERAGMFKSMVYVNEDIGEVPKGRRADPDRFIQGKYGHAVRR